MAEYISYKDAGVNIATGNELVNFIKKTAIPTHNNAVLGGIGGFSACYELPIQDYKQPVLVSTTDGIGTKLKLALQANQLTHLGTDLVAMCVNDLIVGGAKPLFFLDYYASGKLDLTSAQTLITSIAAGCTEANISLIGGETAELPGLYQGTDFDLAGFCVGVIEKADLQLANQITAGDQLIGLASSGFHSNGYSLIRKLLEVHQVNLQQPFGQQTLAEALLTPTKIYTSVMAELFQDNLVKSAAHITGGGLIENIPRILPPNSQAIIDTKSWQATAIFDWIYDLAKLNSDDKYRTFNAGIGMVLCVAKTNLNAVMETLGKLQQTAWHIGEIKASTQIHPSVTLI